MLWKTCHGLFIRWNHERVCYCSCCFTIISIIVGVQGNVSLLLLDWNPKAKFLQRHCWLFASYWKWNANEINVDTTLKRQDSLLSLFWPRQPNQVVANFFPHGEVILLTRKEMHRFTMPFSLILTQHNTMLCSTQEMQKYLKHISNDFNVRL